MFKAEVVLGSKYAGVKLATFKITFPRIILAELNTHRMLSKNTSSSRAIPFEKMLEAVETNPFIPIAWQKDHKGMQGSEYFEDVNDIYTLKAWWLGSRNKAVGLAKDLAGMGLTKQICNRLLEPFMWTTVVITGTEWENFFAQRAHPDAEIHMQQIANLMLEAYNAYEFRDLQAGEWHIPFREQFLETDEWIKFCTGNNPDAQEWDDVVMDALKISTAYCARTSYTSIGDADRKLNLKADEDLHDRIAASGHMSPFEHCAQAMAFKQIEESTMVTPLNRYKSPTDPVHDAWSGNFRNFTQYRKLFRDENKRDGRLNPN